MAHSEFSCLFFCCSFLSWARRRDSAIFLRYAARSFMLARRLIVRSILRRRFDFLIFTSFFWFLCFLSIIIIKIQPNVKWILCIQCMSHIAPTYYHSEHINDSLHIDTYHLECSERFRNRLKTIWILRSFFSLRMTICTQDSYLVSRVSS